MLARKAQRELLEKMVAEVLLGPSGPQDQQVPMARREKSDLLVLQEVLELEAPRVSAERLGHLDLLDSLALLVLMASLVPRAIKEKLDRKVTLVPLAHKAPQELPGHRVLLE